MRAIVLAGHAGHDREITVTLEDYGHGPPLDRSLGPIPVLVEHEFVKSLPETWKIENRGSRLEVHPSGHFAGGFSAEDTATVLAALAALGYEVDDRT